MPIILLTMVFTWPQARRGFGDYQDNTKFSVFSVKSGNIINIYFSPSAFELCKTVLSEKFGFESCDCLEEDLET